jgi:hypothetical protein
VRYADVDMVYVAARALRKKVPSSRSRSGLNFWSSKLALGETLYPCARRTRRRRQSPYQSTSSTMAVRHLSPPTVMDCSQSTAQLSPEKVMRVVSRLFLGAQEPKKSKSMPWEHHPKVSDRLCDVLGSSREISHGATTIVPPLFVDIF